EYQQEGQSPDALCQCWSLLRGNKENRPQNALFQEWHIPPPSQAGPLSPGWNSAGMRILRELSLACLPGFATIPPSMSDPEQEAPSHVATTILVSDRAGRDVPDRTAGV